MENTVDDQLAFFFNPMCVNSAILKKYGPVMSVFITAMIEEDRYAKELNIGQPDGGFSVDSLLFSKNIGLTIPEMRECEKKMFDLGFVTTYKKGKGDKKYYILNHENIHCATWPTSITQEEIA